MNEGIAAPSFRDEVGAPPERDPYKDYGGNANNPVCGDCIGDEFFSAYVKEKGDQERCAYCAGESRTIPLWELVDHVEYAFFTHYEFQTWDPDGEDYLAQKHSGGDWEPRGNPADYVIYEIADVDEKLCNDIHDSLGEIHDTMLPGDPEEEDRFSESSYWAEKPTSGRHLELEWRELEELLRTESRFFSQAADKLDETFAVARSLADKTEKQLIKEIGPDTDLDAVYRAQVFQSVGDLTKAMERPDLRLGPPPSEVAKAGRMNPLGISVFYSATSVETAIAEVRPPVGAKVFTGKFTFLKKLNVLDADVLAEFKPTGSLMEPEFARELEYAEFFRSLQSRFSRPVMPDDEDRDYIATQAVAEYLSEHFEPRVDGILFRSAQAPKAGRNLVLFHRASKVETLVLPGDPEFYVNTHSFDGDDYYPDCYVQATVRATQEEIDAASHVHFERDAFTLDLDFKSLQIHEIESVSYGRQNHAMTWARQDEILPEKTKAEDDDLGF